MIFDLIKNVLFEFCFFAGGLQAAAHHQAQPPIQLLQQIVGPNGEIQHMPVRKQPHREMTKCDSMLFSLLNSR